MLNQLLGRISGVGELKEDLGISSSRLRETAHRIANVTNGVEPGFDDALNGAMAGEQRDPEIDLETEMVALANEQIRYDASADLLRRTYERLRNAVRG